VSLLLLAKNGFGRSVPVPPEPDPQVQAADVWRWDGGSGAVRVASGWPLRPGALMPDALNTVIVRDDANQEVLRSVVALHGRFPDGSLRAVGIQFNAALEDGVARQFSVSVGAGVCTQDLGAWVPIAYDSGSATLPGAQNLCAIIPADSAYWCSTFSALTPVQPEALDVPDDMATFFKTTGSTENTLSRWADYLHTTQGDAAIGVSTYEFVHGLLVAAMRSNDATRRRWFYQRFYACLRLHLGTYAIPSYTADTGSGTVWSRVGQGADPSLPLGTGSGLPPEWHSVTAIGFAAGYLATAWAQPWRILAYYGSSTYGTNTEATAITKYVGASGTSSPRVNMMNQMWRMAAYVVGATMQVKAPPSGYGPGRDNDVASWSNDLLWSLKGLELYQYTTANSSAYVDGIVGQRYSVAIGQVAGSFPTFQLSVVVRMLHFYYNNIAADSRIPGWITSIANMVMTQFRQDGAVYTMPYWHVADPEDNTPVALNGEPNDLKWYYSSFFSELFGLAFGFTANPIYRTWALRCGATSQLAGFIKSYKALGEYFSGHQQSAKYYVDGGAVRAFAGAHPSAITSLPTLSGPGH